MTILLFLLQRSKEASDMRLESAGSMRQVCRTGVRFLKRKLH